MERRICLFEVVPGEFHLVAHANRAIGSVGTPSQIEATISIVEKHSDALKAVGDFNRARIEVQPSSLLKVSKLSDFKSVQKHLPPHAPGTKGWRLPIILLKTDIMLN